MTRPAHVPAIAGLDRAAAVIGQMLGEHLLAIEERVGELSLDVASADLPGVLLRLRDAPELQFAQLMDIVGVDWPERAERFDVVYHLLSPVRNLRVRVRTSTDGERPVPSVVDLWPVAGWFEREVFDMFGVFFDGNPDLRRILTDYGFDGHPFRKDFPLTGHVELRYSEAEGRVIYEPVQLQQDFRRFDFLSPWEGMLPGDEKATGPLTPPAGATP